MYDKKIEETLAQLEERAKPYSQTIAEIKPERKETLKSKVEAGGTRDELREKARVQARAEKKAKLEADAKLRSEQAKNHIEAEAGASSATTQDKDQKKTETKPRIKIISTPAIRTGTCECCDKKNVPKDKLVRIDSGQLFCPDCLMALRN